MALGIKVMPKIKSVYIQPNSTETHHFSHTNFYDKFQEDRGECNKDKKAVLSQDTTA